MGYVPKLNQLRPCVCQDMMHGISLFMPVVNAFKAQGNI